ncbi:MAG: TonB-dependent receptor [Longimicrobiales bacterium]|nr:TonB-dependent receptor [Longimicrobiales bacterium]
MTYPSIRVPVVAVFAIVGLILGTPSAVHAQTGRIEGRVLTRTGDPAPEVLVRIVNLNRNVETSVDGTFAFEEVPAGVHLVQVRSERFGQRSARVEVPSGGVGRVTLELLPLFHLDAVVVSAGPLAARQDELFQSATTLSGDELRSRAQPSLGETLSGKPGIRSTYFGPGASRPVIRGLGGDRVRVLESGLGSGDASSTSPDHAVALDPASAERIEVVRGPATLLYGSSAIGGVVNVFDGRIPREAPPVPLSGRVSGTGGSVSDERNVTGDASFLVGPLVARVAGGYRDTEDYNIPGFARLGADADDPDAEKGVLQNSALETHNLSGGLSWVGARGHLGAAVSGFDSFYGVPGGVEEEDVSVDLEQRRFDLDGELRFDEGFLDRVRLRFGVADYEHVELEGTEIGTEFFNDQWEGRVELRHRSVGPFEGALGFQILDREFTVVGEESFTPPTDTEQFAVFLYEEAGVGPVRLQLGSRVETQDTKDLENGTTADFTGVSISTGVSFAPSDPVSIALSLSRSVKLPSPEELFSDGPHLATRNFEIGDPGLDKEVGYSADLTLHLHEGPARLQLTGFVTDFDDFIFADFTGNDRDGLQEVIFAQDNARFIGIEGETSVEVFEGGGDHLAIELGGDYVRATLTDTDEALPRIPSWSFGGGPVWEGSHLTGRTTVRRVGAQNRVGRFETSTPGYTMINAEVGYQLRVGGLSHQFSLQGRNLADNDARAHTSFLKEFVPMPGRDVRLVYSVGF